MEAVFQGSSPSALRRPAGTGTIVEVLDAAALPALQPQWEALAADAAEANPFYEHWMLLPALQAFGEGEGFRCVAVWQDGTLGALFPMQLHRRFRGMPLPTLRSWSHRNMLHCTPLIRGKAGSQNAVKCVTALLQSRLASVYDFDWTCTDGYFYGALVESILAAGLPWMVTDAYMRPALVRGRDPRERFNSNTRNNLRRNETRLRAHGELTSVRLAAGDDLQKWIDDFIRLEASGWKGRAGTAIGCREDDRRFFGEVFAEAFRRERLVITGLDLAGKPLARHVMLSAGEGCFSLKLGYDEAHEKCSPGMLAELDNVRQFMETPGPRWIDSNTARESQGYGRVWKDCRTVQRIAVGVSGLGRLAVTALPFMRLAKHFLRGLRPVRSGANDVRQPA
jgi:CelD/BcsL family acetyltransferase involved in cellulose biosynthesis